MCIKGIPEKNIPTVLVYRDGEIKKQIMTLRDFSGSHISFKDMSKVLPVD